MHKRIPSVFLCNVTKILIHFGKKFVQNFSQFFLDKNAEMCYNKNFDPCAGRHYITTIFFCQIKKSEYFNSLNCATGFTQHSVGTYCAPLPMTFWRISLTYKIYFGGLLILFTLLPFDIFIITHIYTFVNS